MQQSLTSRECLRSAPECGRQLWQPSCPPPGRYREAYCEFVSLPQTKAIVIAGAAACMLAALSAAAIGPTTTTRTTGWTIEHLTAPVAPDGSSLSELSCSSASSCLAVGSNARGQENFAEVWNGKTWRERSMPYDKGGVMSTINGVACTTSSSCTAVGDLVKAQTSVALAEFWDGSKWTVQPTPSSPSGFDPGLISVACSSTSWCMALGEASRSDSQSSLFAERWNGRRWSLLAFPNPARTLDIDAGLACLAPTMCMAIGYYLPSANSQLAFYSLWNGQRWLTHRLNLGGRPDINQLSCSGADACTAVGYYYDPASDALVLRWNGKVWVRQAISQPAERWNPVFTAVSCPTVRDCTAVGYSMSATYGIATPLVETWSGSTWSPVRTPTPLGDTGGLRDVACSTPRSCIAVGVEGQPWKLAPLVERS